MTTYAEILPKFQKFHQVPQNNDCHVATLAIGLAGAAGLVTRAARACAPTDATGRYSKARAAAALLWVAYALAIFCTDVPPLLACRCACFLIFCVGASAKLDLGWAGSAAALAAGYLLQDASHWFYGEETLQRNSWGAADADPATIPKLFFEHVVYLLPLTLDGATAACACVATLSPLLLWAWGNVAIDSDSAFGLPFLPAKTRLLVGKFESQSDVADLKACRAWCVNKGPDHETTSHWWLSDLDAPTKAAFERLVYSKRVDDLFRTKFAAGAYQLEPVLGMNELYVSAPCRRDVSAKNSDDVFFTEHVDGPYCLFPFASVFRCIVALDANVAGYTTHFPNAHRDCTATEGDILAFDFHRESHFISTKPGGAFHPENVDALAKDPTQKWRMVLKFHYAVAPTGLWWCCGRPLHWLSTRYNEAFRALFLATITPKTAFEKFVADLGVNGTTIAYNAVEKYCGFGNVLVYAALAVLAYSLGSYDVFLYSTQYLHYLRYVSTYYVRKGVAFGSFKRDVLLYKSIALAQLFAIYASPLFSDEAKALCGNPPCLRPDSLVLIVAGYVVSICATAALGVDGTYFGIELGVVEADYKFVTKFPYNVLPHPMILGQVVALFGVHVAPQVSRARPLLVPIHIALYLTHMLQEQFDYHDGVPWYKKAKCA
mmetsp:Transcript_373/g.1070  ORF Transcript_373/g.1070 Transcript_373/m.1070 type:complete len:660 (+) Transcript_373:181-2160(+)